MKNFSLALMIVEILCGLVCIGFGIYYCFGGSWGQIAVFLIVGAVCVVTGVRTFILLHKRKKQEEEENKNSD